MSRPTVVDVEARSYELDPYGHLNNAVYVNWLEHGRLCFLRERGATYTSLPESHGVHVVVVRQEVSYRVQVRLGDQLGILSTIAAVGRTSFTFAQEIRFAEGGRVAADAKVVMVCVGPDGRARTVPPELRQLLLS